MSNTRTVHPDFHHFLSLKEPSLVDLFLDLRSFMFEIYPESNELLYHTHALTAVFSISEKLSDAFCHIPIYSNHLNLGFNQGTLLDDPNQLLQGTGKVIRHIPITKSEDYRNDQVKTLVQTAIDYTLAHMDKPAKKTGQTISKIKK